jgi:hypothetical protein
MKRALVAAILFCTVQALGATPSPDGWADLHWGMTAKQVLALYPKGIVKATKTPENIWIVLPPISLPGGKYTVEAGVKDKAGLWLVTMGPAEKRTRTIAETKERLRELEDALVLKYGPPAIKRKDLTTWRFEKLQIELRSLTDTVPLLLLVYFSPSNNPKL